MPHTLKQEKLLRARGIPFLSTRKESSVKKYFAQKYNVPENKIQINRKYGTNMKYIVTIFNHEKPVVKFGKKEFIVS